MAAVEPVDDHLPAGVREEAEAIVGARFTAVERVARGYSRASFRATTDDGRRYAIRVAPPDGPTTGTELDLAREAAYLRALTPTGITVPALHGVGADGSFLVTDWAAGRPGVGDMSPEDRDAVYLRYIDELAALHQVDVRSLDVPGADDDDPTAGARNELRLWRRVLEAKVARPRPLAWFGLAVLSRAPAPGADHLTVCHGDPGPGNFLHDGERVTALLDWEFAHIGDPVDDLAWWAFRGHELTGDCGDLDAQLRRWTAATGTAVPDASFRYYKAFAALRFYISLVVMLENAKGVVDRAVPLRVLDRVGVALPRLIAELRARPLPTYHPPVAGPVEVGADAVSVLRTALADVALPNAPTPEVRRRVANALPVVDLLERSLATGHAIAEEELAELQALLSRRVDSVADGHRELLGIVDDPEREDALLEHFWRSSRRNDSLWQERER